MMLLFRPHIFLNMHQSCRAQSNTEVSDSGKKGIDLNRRFFKMTAKLATY